MFHSSRAQDGGQSFLWGGREPEAMQRLKAVVDLKEVLNPEVGKVLGDDSTQRPQFDLLYDIFAMLQQWFGGLHSSLFFRKNQLKPTKQTNQNRLEATKTTSNQL